MWLEKGAILARVTITKRKFFLIASREQYLADSKIGGLITSSFEAAMF
jgi:hypothetical protein